MLIWYVLLLIAAGGCAIAMQDERLPLMVFRNEPFPDAWHKRLAVVGFIVLQCAVWGLLFLVLPIAAVSSIAGLKFDAFCFLLALVAGLWSVWNAGRAIGLQDARKKLDRERSEALNAARMLDESRRKLERAEERANRPKFKVPGQH